MIYPIVGHFYRKPAPAVLDSLPLAHPLELLAEPSNPVDPNAIAVWIDPATIIGWKRNRLDALEAKLLGYGNDYTLDWLLFEPLFQLGYLPAAAAKVLKPSWPAPHIIVAGYFAVGSKGGPQVRFDL